MRRSIALLVALVLALIPFTSLAADPVTTTTVAEKKVDSVPAGANAWCIKDYPDKSAAQAAAGNYGLVAEVGGKVWLATLGTGSGQCAATVGPLTMPNASQYLIRVMELKGPSGGQTAVHMHPGSESYYVLAGSMKVQSDSGTKSASAGQALVGPGAGTAMQVTSTGSQDVQALALFVVDASQAFSTPTEFHAGHTVAPQTGAGHMGSPVVGLLTAIAAAAVFGLGIALRRLRHA